MELNVDGTVAYANPPNYRAEVEVGIPTRIGKKSGDNLKARLVSHLSGLYVDSTDKVNTVYYVQNPDYGGDDWPAQVVMAYDDGNGRNQTQDLSGAGFNTIQSDDPGSLSIISGAGMKAGGALSGHPRMKKWYDQSRLNALSDDIRFWMMLDEPDARSGHAALTLKEGLYDPYYEYNTNAYKPYSLNISVPIYIEEFCEACDVIISDPYVYKKPPEGERGTGKYNQNRISDTAAEMKYVADIADAGKKTIIVLWWWFPAQPGKVEEGDVDVFKASWCKGMDADVSGLAGYQFSRTFRDSQRRLVTNVLSTYTQNPQVPLLWTAIKEKIASGAEGCPES